MVVVYKTGFVTYQIARRLLKLESIALVNLVAGQRIVPELIQRQASAERLVDEISAYRHDVEHCRRTVEALHRLPALLGGEGASARAAAIIGEYL
jgi:lipid-A-disaccharide synthase